METTIESLFGKGFSGLFRRGFTPKNNRKRTRGRNYIFITDKQSGKTHKQWINH